MGLKKRISNDAARLRSGAGRRFGCLSVMIHPTRRVAGSEVTVFPAASVTT
jgi:hypothetical protein